jgi:hypothetical protein
MRALSNNALKLTKRGSLLVVALRAPFSLSRASQLSAVFATPKEATIRAACLGCVTLLSGLSFGDPVPVVTPRPYWQWVSGSLLVQKDGSWTVEVLHGGRVIVNTGEHRLTAELSAEQRRKLAALTAALPTERRSYQLGRFMLEGPEFSLRVDDGTQKRSYEVVGVGRTPSEVREIRAIVDVATFLRSLASSDELFDPRRWLFPDHERESNVP